MKRILLGIGSLLITHFGTAAGRPQHPSSDTSKPTLMNLLTNLKTITAVATGDGQVKEGVDREKALREGLYRVALSSKQLLDKDLPKPASETETILYELAQACTYGLFSICYEKNYIPDDNPFNYGRDVAIYKPLTEHALAYWSYKPDKLKNAYYQGNLTSNANQLESFAQVMNKMLHREMMNAWEHSKGLGDLGRELKQNIWKYYRIYFPLFKSQDYVMNKGPLTDLFGGQIWDMEEFYSMPRWISLLGDQAGEEEIQLLSDNYFHKITMHYKWNSYSYGPASADKDFGKQQEYLTGLYKTWVPVREPETDQWLKKKLKKNQYQPLSVIPPIVLDNYRENVPLLDATGFKNEITRLTRKYLPGFTEQAFSALKVQEDPNYSLEFFCKQSLRQIDFIFNKLKINEPELESSFVAGLLDYMRTRAETGLFATTKEYAGKLDELTGYFNKLLSYLKTYATRVNNSNLKDKLDEISAAMEKDPYTAAPPHFFQDPEVLSLVKKL